VVGCTFALLHGIPKLGIVLRRGTLNAEETFASALPMVLWLGVDLLSTIRRCYQ